jgi:glutamate synthase domain-containing protein 3
MKVINATSLDYKALNEILRKPERNYVINGCCGQRFIGAGMSDRNIVINGISGNALGAYLNNASITVNANAQDAVGDTMNAGKILIHGSIGDAAGYAMRGGKIYIRDHAGYRAGIHMKEYKDKIPVMIIGGCAGSFLGEYQAGGILIVLGLHTNHRPIIGNFPCTGMHGGRLFLRGDCRNLKFPPQVTASIASPENLRQIMEDLREYCDDFHYDPKSVLSSPFTLVTPNSKNPYKQMYVAN